MNYAMAVCGNVSLPDILLSEGIVRQISDEDAALPSVAALAAAGYLVTGTDKTTVASTPFLSLSKRSQGGQLVSTPAQIAAIAAASISVEGTYEAAELAATAADEAAVTANATAASANLTKAINDGIAIKLGQLASANPGDTVISDAVTAFADVKSASDAAATAANAAKALTDAAKTAADAALALALANKNLLLG
jgi:hypothetical protein